MAKLKEAKQQPLIPTTPEELAALVAAPPAPAGPETKIAESLKGPQGELLTGMPPKPAPGPETQVPIELKGAQGELLTQQIMPEAKITPKVEKPVAPAVAAEPPAAPEAVSKFETPTTVEEAAVEQEAAKKEAPDWLKKLGIVAKNTGRGILELISDFAHGYTGGQGPNVTERRMDRETQEKLKANEQDFALKLQQLQQEWQAAQATSRNAEELEQQRRAIEAQAAQAEADRQANAQDAAAGRASQERIAGLRTGGAMPGEDPAVAYLRQLFGGGK